MRDMSGMRIWMDGSRECVLELIKIMLVEIKSGTC